MQVGVLGPVAVVDDDGAEVAVGSPSQRTVLAVLAAADGRAVGVDRLVEALWGDDPPRTAEQSLRTYVSRLRRVLGARLAGRGGAYALELDPEELDARRFESLVDAAATLAPGDAAATLGQALGLWRGEPFADLVDPAVVGGEARRLTERRTGARQARARALLGAGDAAGATAAAEALVAEEPLREGAWVVLVDALCAAHRAADALRAVQRASAALADAGLSPSAVLREAEQRALSGDGLPPAPKPQERPATAVVAEPLVGRDVDVAQVEALLDRARVVTVHGPGGVGKTSLARQVLAARGPSHRLGARAVPLAPLAEAGAVPLAVAEALGMTVTDGSAQEALARAGALDVLICLDSCEHVLDAVAEVVELLIAGGDQARILVTSRERIGVAGEHSWSLAPLPTGVGGAGVDLFLERARSVAPDLTLTERREEVARIVDLLDGLPLAMEMAAARVGGLGLADLERILSERFDILRATRRRGDPRHRTLTAVVEWSEDLLDADEREVLADLAVFAGPVEGPEIEAVLDRPRAIDAVCGLVDRSLVVARDRDAQASYGLLEMVRRHARDRLDASGRAPDLARRHALAFTDVARQADAALRTPGEGDASRRVDRATAELRSARAWAAEHEPGVLLALLAALHVHSCSRQQEEARTWAERALPVLDRSPEAAVVLATVGYHANDRGHPEAARAAAERSLEVAGDDPVARHALEVLADTALYQGDLAHSQELSRRMRDAAERAGDTRALAMAVSGIALTSAYAGDLDAAVAVLAGVDLTGMGPSSQGWVHYAEGEAVLDADPDRAVDAFSRATALSDDAGDRFLGAVARVSSTSLLGRVGEPVAALAAFGSVVEHWHQRGDVTHQLTTLRNLVGLLVRVGAPGPAAELLGAVREAPGAPSFGEEAARLEGASAGLRATLGSAYERHLGVGAARDVPTAAVAALAALADLIDAG